MKPHLNLKSIIYSKLRLSFTESRAKRKQARGDFPITKLSYLTASIIRYEAKNVMPSEEKERNIYRREKEEEEEEERKREKGNNCAARVHAKSGASPFGSYVDPSVLRSPVRASFAMLRSDKHPPLGPSSVLRHPSVPLSKSTERSLTRAARRAQPPLRPHRDLTAVVNAEMERERERERETLIDVSSFHHIRSLVVSPCGRRAPPPPTRVRFLLLLSSAASFTSSFSSTAQPRDTLA